LAEFQNGVSDDKEFKNYNEALTPSFIIFKINFKEIAILVEF
jgi:hypothetical protein